MKISISHDVVILASEPDAMLSGIIVSSGQMNHNGSLFDNGKANYGSYSQKPPVAPMAIGLTGLSNAANKLKQQLEQQDQVQFYQKIKQEIQVEEHQQMVKKFYQQQKQAFDFPKVIFPSGPIHRNGPHSGRNSSISGTMVNLQSFFLQKAKGKHPNPDRN